MKHITKREFNEHGWRKGDKVRTGKGIESVVLISLTREHIWTGVRGIYYTDILEIIPRRATGKKSVTNNQKEG